MIRRAAGDGAHIAVCSSVLRVTTNRRVRSFLPLLLVPLAAILSALAVHLVLGRGIYFMEMWLNGLFAISGYVYGAVWRRL